jgi:hypothetical protein
MVQARGHWREHTASDCPFSRCSVLCRMRKRMIVTGQRHACVLPERLAAIAVGCSFILAACGGDSLRGTNARSDEAAARSAADTATAGASASSTANMRYDTLPARGRFVGGSVLMQPTGAPSSFVFSQVQTSRGDVLRLDSVVSGAPPDRSRIIRAELAVPPLAPDERLLIGSCDIGGRLDPALVAIVVADAGAARYTRIRQAWRVRPAEGRFEVVPVRGITCEETDRGG